MKKLFTMIVSLMLVSGFANAQQTSPINGFPVPSTGSVLLSNGDVVTGMRGASPYNPQNPTYSLRVGMGGTCPTGQYVTSVSAQGVPNCASPPALSLGGNVGDIQFNNGTGLGGYGIGSGLSVSGGMLQATGTVTAIFPSGIPGQILGYTATGTTPSLFTPNGNITINTTTGVSTINSIGLTATGSASALTVVTDSTLAQASSLANRMKWALDIVNDCHVPWPYDGTDQTSNLAACETEAQTFTPPKALLFWPGVVTASTAVTQNDAHICLGGPDACTVRAPAGSNKWALDTVNWNLLIGTSTNTGANQFYSFNMTYDGNYPSNAGNAGGGSARLYGANKYLTNTNFINSPSYCFWNAYGGSDQANHGLEDFIVNAKYDTCYYDGLRHDGPHDDKYLGGVIIDANRANSTDPTLGSSIYKSAGGFDLFSYHTWRRSGFLEWSFYDATNGQEGDNITAGFFETGGDSSGGGGGLYLSSQATYVDPVTRVQQYAGGSGAGIYGVWLANNSIVMDGQVTCNGGSTVGVKIGGRIGTPVYYVGNAKINSIVSNCPSGSLDRTYDNGNSEVTIQGSSGIIGSGNSTSTYHVQNSSGSAAYSIPNVYSSTGSSLTIGPTSGTNLGTIISATGTGASGGAVSMSVGGQTRYNFSPQGYANFNSSGYAPGYGSTNNYFPGLQYNAGSGSQSGVGVMNYANDNTPSEILCGKARTSGGIPGGGLASQTGDGACNFGAYASDSSHNLEVGSLRFIIEGTATVGANPGRGSIFTANASGNSTEATRWDSSQNTTAYGSFNLATTGKAYQVGGNNILSVPASDVNSLAVGVGALASLSATAATYENQAFGYNALNSTTTGSYNLAVGYKALSSNTTGINNTGVGFFALYDALNAGGNTMLGSNAGQHVTAGNNTAIGFYSMLGASGSTTGTNNTAVGQETLRNIQSGSQNTTIGYQSGLSLTTGVQNSAIGYQALPGNNSYSSCLGYKCLSNAAANSNAALGYNSGSSITTGSYNVIIGNQVASTTLTTGSSNILIGTSTLVDTTASNSNNQLNIGGIITGDMSGLSVTVPATFITTKGIADQSYSYQTPLTGTAITFGAGVTQLVLNPAGTLATLTIIMPASPIDGQKVFFSSTQVITALTVSPNSGQSVADPQSSLTVGGSGGYIYRSANTTWYRIL